MYARLRNCPLPRLILPQYAGGMKTQMILVVTSAVLGVAAGAVPGFGLPRWLSDRQAKSCYARGYQQLTQSNSNEALASFSEAIRLEPDFAEAYCARGTLKSDSEALSDYDKAIRLDPRFAAAYSNRAIARENLGNQAGAMADYDRAIELDPHFSDAFDNRAGLKAMHHNYSGAIQDYTQAIKVNCK